MNRPPCRALSAKCGPGAPGGPRALPRHPRGRQCTRRGPLLLGQEVVEVLHDVGPVGLVAVPRGLVCEAFMSEAELGPVLARRELDLDACLDAVCRFADPGDLDQPVLGRSSRLRL